MFDRLIDKLQSQLDVYAELLESARQKKAGLLTNDIEAIRRVTARENSLIGILRRLERERESLTSEMAKHMRIPVNGLTLAKLIGRVEDPAAQKALDSLRLRLRENMDVLKAVNEQNKALINQSLEYIDFNMNLLRNTVSGPVYAGDKEIHGQVFFDARG